MCESDGAITLSPSNIVDGKMDYASCTYISWKKYNESPEIQIRENDILLVKTGSSYGKCALVNNLPKEATINPQYVVLKYISVVPLYLTYILQSNYARECFDKFVLGTAIPTFTQEKLGNLVIPLPPYREQLKIVNKINELQGYVSNLYDYFRNLSISITKVKSKILELAMEGKLVPQDPADESAAEMLKRINPKANIITDNPHYPNLPNNWVLTDIQSVCNYGKCDSVNVNNINEGDWILELEDIEKDSGVILEKERKGDREVKGVRHTFQSGDILYSKLRTYLNKVLIAPTSGYCSTEIIPIKCHDSVTAQYLCAWLRSPYFLAYTQSCGYGVKMPRISTTDARNGIVPLPPLNEQRRIMEQVHSIFEVLDAISNSANYP